MSTLDKINLIIGIIVFIMIIINYTLVKKNNRISNNSVLLMLIAGFINIIVALI